MGSITLRANNVVIHDNCISADINIGYNECCSGHYIEKIKVIITEDGSVFGTDEIEPKIELLIEMGFDDENFDLDDNIRLAITKYNSSARKYLKNSH